MPHRNEQTARSLERWHLKCSSRTPTRLDGIQRPLLYRSPDSALPSLARHTFYHQPLHSLHFYTA